jgi:hypothetical protein
MICACCQHGTARSYCRPALMGRSEPLCWFCFLAWYESAKVTDEGIRAESIRLRHETTTLQEHTGVRHDDAIR